MHRDVWMWQLLTWVDSHLLEVQGLLFQCRGRGPRRLLYWPRRRPTEWQTWSGWNIMPAQGENRSNQEDTFRYNRAEMFYCMFYWLTYTNQCNPVVAEFGIEGIRHRLDFWSLVVWFTVRTCHHMYRNEWSINNRHYNRKVDTIQTFNNLFHYYITVYCMKG